MRKMLAGLVLAAAAVSAYAIPEGPDPSTPAWFQREAQNYARTGEAPLEEIANPDFLLAWVLQTNANHLEWIQRAAGDPSWLLYPSGNTTLTPLAATWGLPATGDPTRYADMSGPNGSDFYSNEAEVVPVVIYDDGCARLSGRVWAPKGSHAGSNLPNVVIENGSIQAPETLYWWFAQQLVRAGYVVMTFDPRGQGRSDQQTPDGTQGSNANAAVFWTGLVNVIDFFRSNPVTPYPHNVACAGTYPTQVTAFNPFHDRIDLNRLGIAGHSLGATGVSVVQGYGAPGADPWPGKIDAQNPVKVAVAWDGLSTGGGMGAPMTKPRVPAMSQNSEYGIGGAPFNAAPDPEGKKAAYAAWSAAGVPVVALSIQGSTHFEWSLLPSFPATSWCADMSSGSCLGGWGNPMAQHYSLAWMDRWLKNPGESGYDDADARLLDDAPWCERYSFYYRAGRNFPDRGGAAHHAEDIRADCLAAAAGGYGTAATAAADKSARYGGALNGALLLGLFLTALRRRATG